MITTIRGTSLWTVVFAQRQSSATINLQDLPIDEAGKIGREEHHRIGDVLSASQAFHRDTLNQSLLPVSAIAFPLLLGRCVGTNKTGSDGVHRDVVWPELMGEL